MKNKFEYFLLSILLGTAVLLGLSLWLNTFFGFNLFFKEHWDELAKLQASHTPIANGFYVSIAIAMFIFIIGLYVIYISSHKDAHKKQEPVMQPVNTTQNTTTTKIEEPETVSNENSILLTRPPKLNLPKNMAQLIAKKQAQNSIQQTHQLSDNSDSTNPYNSTLNELFSANGYLVKNGARIAGFSPNLFAIGGNEVLWIGGVDSDINKLKQAIEKLQDVFQTTLEDIPINIKSFILDNLNKYQPIDNILIFKSLEELKTFVSENPADKLSDEEQDSFNSYSEYIDTIITYLKNI